jgi:hypothetical protein
VLAYAFLAEGRVEPLTGFAWPTRRGGTSSWVDAEAAPREALRGYRAHDLPYWLDDELWSVELEGTVAARDHVLVAERARLLGRVDTWTEELAGQFVAECAQRVARKAAVALRDDGLAGAASELERAKSLDELERAALAAAESSSPGAKLAGYVTDVCFYARDAGSATRAAGIAAKMSAYALAGEVDDPLASERLVSERAWQAAWLVERLDLRPD